MTSIQMLVCVVLLLQTVWAATRTSTGTSIRTSSQSYGQSRCEPLKIKICQKLNYNKTVFPNFAGHRSQWEANQYISSFVPLLNSGCSPDLLHLICSYYAPVCTSYRIMVHPCRSLCKRVRDDCTPTIIKLYGKADWPKELDCKKFPRRKNAVCFGRPRTRKSAKSLNFF
ncbi:Fz1 [Paramuricea clavata]|uniref:Fz1, partial n=1 Tax=Paramuricea clavata TaxID=317549 RepID=A0A6S7FXH4_PARCT|nr:Fz1 [Paramuricea clavata]